MAMSAFATLCVALVIVGLWAVWSYRGPGPQARRGEITNVMLRRGITDCP